MEFSGALIERIYRVLEEAGRELQTKDIRKWLQRSAKPGDVSSRLHSLGDNGYLTHCKSGSWLRGIRKSEEEGWYALQQAFGRIDAARQEQSKKNARVAKR